tara:strand:- start:49812 stop:50180 length:369 start_codon:yes stop_codon:yes gene_type:complete
MRTFLLTLVLILVAALPVHSDGGGKYQITKATEDRVWRLNTETGEIAVCKLEGENLICTTTSDAAAVPKKSYDQISAEREAAEQAAIAADAEQRQRELKILDRILAFFREMLATAMGQSSGG